MNQSEYKIRNLESSIVYLQLEHADMLKLLHKEIKDLQMKNSDLTFQISMQSVGLSVDSDNAEMADNSVAVHTDPHVIDEMGKLEEQVCLLNSENESKSKQLGNYERTICQLTRDIEKLKKGHQARIVAMEIDLNNKSAEIVQLSTKLHNWKKLDVRPGNLGDLDRCSRSAGQPVPGGPPRILQLRNQVSVHREDSPVRGRPVVGRHTMVSMAHPIKSRAVHPVPQCAVSTEERCSFSKSVKRPTILPPINSVRHNWDYRQSSSAIDNASVYLRDSSGGLADSLCLVGCREASNRELIASSTIANVDMSVASATGTLGTGVGLTKATAKLVRVEIDKVIDMGHTAAVSNGNDGGTSDDSGGTGNNNHSSMSTSMRLLLLPTAGHGYRDRYSP